MVVLLLLLCLLLVLVLVLVLLVVLLPQTDEILSFVPNAYFTAITSSGTADLYITPGDGL